MDAYGDSNVYRVIENGGGHPFDQYDGHAVIVFEEFRSSFKNIGHAQLSGCIPGDAPGEILQ